MLVCRHYHLSPQRLLLPREEKAQAKEEEIVGYDEQGRIPLTDTGRRMRRRVRQFLGIGKSTRVALDESQAVPLEDIRSNWRRDDSGKWVRVDDAEPGVDGNSRGSQDDRDSDESDDESDAKNADAVGTASNA